MPFVSATELLARIQTREASAAETVEEHIRRIEAVDSLLNAVVVPLFDDALSRARAADERIARGEPLRALSGLPVTVKESFAIAGTPATAGVRALAGRLGAADAPLVAELKAAGAIVVGKTNLSQLVWFNEADNPIYGRTNNPWSLERSPGGSSGGEAAIVAAGGSPLGIGTDSGGSVRRPAHCCGVHGLKPTPGRLSAAGTVDELILGARAEVSSQPGPLARTVADLRLVMDALGESLDPVSVGRLRVGFYVDDRTFTPSPAVRRAVEEAAAALVHLGADVEEFVPPAVAGAMRLFARIFAADGGLGLRRILAGTERDPRIDLALGEMRRSAVSPSEVNAYRSRFARELEAGGFDALICPPLGVPAPTHGSSFELRPAESYASLFNLLGMPAGVVAATRVRPGEEDAREIDRGSAGLPVGVQVAARPWRDDIVLAVMESLEEHFRASGDYPDRPPI